MDRYLPLLQILVSLVMIALATYIGELVKAHEGKRSIPGWLYWHHGLANSQWGFASFYIALIWTERLTFLRIVALVLFLVCTIAFGFSTGFASRIALSEEPHCSATNYERWNNRVAGVSLLAAVGLAISLIWFSSKIKSQVEPGLSMAPQFLKQKRLALHGTGDFPKSARTGQFSHLESL